MSPVRILENPTVPETAEDFLRALGGPSFLFLQGKDRSRTRALSVLLHGNEPSSLRALHAYLRSKEKPAVNVACFIGAVEAALLEPVFSRRMLPGRRDLNRVWRPPFADVDGKIAEAALALLRARDPECAIDVHNNTGHNPVYGVGPRIDRECRELVSLFSDKFIENQIALGTFTECFAESMPTVTVECGRAGDPAADIAAERGLRRYFAGERGTTEMTILAEPIRVCVHEEVRLSFAESPTADAHLTLRHDIDHHNFQSVPAGYLLGWLAPGIDWPFEARDAAGAERSRDFFVVRGREVLTRREMIPIMMTTSAVAAKIDCLFYIVSPRVD